MKRLIEAVIITVAIAIVADSTLFTTGISPFKVSGQQVNTNLESIAFGTVKNQTHK